MSKHKIPEALRLALWRAHGYRCVYTGEYLRRDEVVVDHVIPETYASRPAELGPLLVRFGKKPNFDLLGLENLVPTFASLNAHKREKVGPGEIVRLLDEKMRAVLTVSERGRTWKEPAETLVRRGLDSAHAKVTEVRAMKEQVKEELCVVRSLLRFQEQGGSARRIMELASGQDTEFSGSGVTDVQAGWMTVVERTAHLSVRLPKFPHLRGSALLTLKSPLVLDCMFTFGAREVAAGLLVGGEGADLESRPFVIESGPDKCWVQFGSTSFWLLRRETEDVCRAVDRLRPLYVEAVQEVENNVYRSTGLDWARQGYRLMHVDLAEWALLVRFASAHAYAAAEQSEWNVFEVRPGSLRFVCPHANEPEAKVRAVVHAEWGEETVVHVHGARWVWICWDPRVFASVLHAEDRFRAGVIWDAATTSEWVRAAISRAKEWDAETAPARAAPGGFRYRVSDMVGRLVLPAAVPAAAPKQTNPPMLSAGSSGLNSQRFSRLEDLRSWLQDVQQFYDAHDELSVKPDVLIGLYELLLWCLGAFTGLDAALPYVLGNLGAPEHGDAARELRERIARCEMKGEGAARSVDLAARSLLEVLDRGTPAQAPVEVLRQATRNLSPLAALLDELRQVERLARKRW